MRTTTAKRRTLRVAIVAAAAGGAILAAPAVASADTGITEYTGGTTSTWSDPDSAGGSPGAVYGPSSPVTVDCVKPDAFPVSDGNQAWYHIEGTDSWASADAFFNNGAQSGSLSGTPFVDPAVPVCGEQASSAPAPSASTQPATQASDFYNRNDAVEWALQHAQDPQHNGTLCTVFASDALWAGGFPQSDSWKPDGGGAASNVQPFVDYVTSHFDATLSTPFTLDPQNNVVPGAEPGDVLVYNWNDGGSETTFSHIAFIVRVDNGYPIVSEWGNKDPFPIWRHWSGWASPYPTRGWTWSAISTPQHWLQENYPQATAMLLHINGGHLIDNVPNF